MDSVATLTQADLDPATLNDLVQDLSLLTEVLAINIKGGTTHRAEASQQELPELVTQLERGELRGIQIHYRWEGKLWLDTLLRSPSGIRLVRTEMNP